MSYYLGLDAGGTKTECALAEGETILARVTGGPIKTLRVAPETAEQNLIGILREITIQCGIPLQRITRTCIGLAGSSVPRIADWTRQALSSRIAGDLLLAGDEEIALDAAFAGGPGVLVVAGTGSNIIGRDSQGQRVHVGGWGPGLSDEGSGHWIGKQAVRAVFDALDRDEPSRLLPQILERWGLPDIGSLIDCIHESPGPDFSTLAPLVGNLATQQDPAAQRILDHAGTLLGEGAVLTVERLRRIAPGDLPNLKIAFTGSVLRYMPAVRNTMCAIIQKALPDVALHADLVDPLLGALWLARHPEQAPSGSTARFPRATPADRPSL